MTTHNNTPKDQYHRAPLNGLIIGTIVGTVCAAVFLLASEGTEFNLAIVAVALGLVRVPPDRGGLAAMRRPGRASRWSARN